VRQPRVPPDMPKPPESRGHHRHPDLDVVPAISTLSGCIQGEI
jgi:hypothetical protein